jgi:mxaJ protein
MVFDIALGVRKEDKWFRDELNRVLHDRRVEIDSLLRAYNVPRIDAGSPPAIARAP